MARVCLGSRLDDVDGIVDEDGDEDGNDGNNVAIIMMKMRKTIYSDLYSRHWACSHCPCLIL